MIRLVASDLDGTILQNGATEVSEEMFECIREMKKRGILFVIASGRQHDSLANLFAPVKDDIAFICENGGAVFCGGKLIHCHYIDMELQKRIIRLMEASPGTELLISDEVQCYIKPKKDTFPQVVRNIGNKYDLVEDWETFDHRTTKLAMYEEEAIGNEAKRLAYWQKTIPAPAWPVTAGIGWIDVIFPWSNKGVGMKALQERLGILPEECAAFGDNLNDMELFDACGWKVAVENAKEPLKKRADAITPTVPEYIRKLLKEQF